MNRIYKTALIILSSLYLTGCGNPVKPEDLKPIGSWKYYDKETGEMTHRYYRFATSDGTNFVVFDSGKDGFLPKNDRDELVDYIQEEPPEGGTRPYRASGKEKRIFTDAFVKCLLRGC